MIIDDGTGTGNKLKINEHNQAYTFSVTRTEIAEESLDNGQAYVCSTGFLDITNSSSFNGVLYIKNTDSKERNMFIEHIRICGSEGLVDPCHIKVKLIRNPTTGTLISQATSSYTANSNFGSPNTFNGLSYKGGDSYTITDGDWFTQAIVHNPGHSVLDYNDSVILPKGSSIGIMVQPCDAIDLCCEVNVHFK